VNVGLEIVKMFAWTTIQSLVKPTLGKSYQSVFVGMSSMR
jgi:hypothetical protein